MMYKVNMLLLLGIFCLLFSSSAYICFTTYYFYFLHVSLFLSCSCLLLFLFLLFSYLSVCLLVYPALSFISLGLVLFGFVLFRFVSFRFVSFGCFRIADCKYFLFAVYIAVIIIYIRLFCLLCFNFVFW